MIFFGTGGKISKAKLLPELRCESCGQNSLTIYTVFRYFHVWWIPVIPTSRKLVSECPHCKHVVTGKDAAASDRFGPTHNIKTEPIPLYLFSGLFLLGAFVGWGVYYDHHQNTQSLSYLQAPLQNDYYVVKLDQPIVDGNAKLHYVVFRLVKLEQDRFHFYQSNYAFPRASDAKSWLRKDLAKHSDNFDPSELVLVESEIETMHRNGNINQIIRLAG